MHLYITWAYITGGLISGEGLISGIITLLENRIKGLYPGVLNVIFYGSQLNFWKKEVRKDYDIFLDISAGHFLTTIKLMHFIGVNFMSRTAPQQKPEDITCLCDLSTVERKRKA